MMRARPGCWRGPCAALALAAACAAAPGTGTAAAQPPAAGTGTAAGADPATDGTAASTPAPDPAALPQIVVTSTKQAQDQQQAPAAITIISGADLVQAGATDIRAVQDLVPSARFQQQNVATEIYLRGVGSTLDFPQIESPTAFTINGIHIPREATGVPLYDVDQLEVLPGPQGTLYGRSAMGGAVDVTLRRPTARTETDALFETGNYDLLHLGAMRNIPLAEALDLRVAADYHTHSGYETSGADSQDDLAGRVSLLARPSGSVTAYLWAATLDKDGHPPNLVVKGVNPATGQLDPGRYLNGNPWNDQFPAPYAARLPDGQPRAQSQKYANRMTGGQVDVQLDDATTLSWIPSYLYLASSADYWLGAFPGNETNNYRQATSEWRVAARYGWGTSLAGLYAYDLDSDGSFTFGGFTLATGFPVSIVDGNRIKGASLFGQVTVDLSDALRWTGGGRLSRDERLGSGRYPNGAGLAPYTYDQGFHHVDYQLGLEYDLAPSTMAYAGTQTAYQPGSFNAYASTPAASNAIGEARLTAYSAGIKHRSRDGRLQIDDEIFYYDYRGLFASAYNTVLNSNQTFNAQKVRITGDQLDLTWQATSADRLHASVGYLHARNVRFELPDGSANYDGLQLQYAPDWTINAGFAHDVPLPVGHVTLQAQARYEDSFYADYAHTPGGYQQGYVKTDATLTYVSARGDWTVAAWVRNISNVAVIAATAGGSNLPPLATGATAFLEPPRTFGVRTTWHL